MIQYYIPKPIKSVTIVTPTLDKETLYQGIISVQNQITKYEFRHLLVYDGVTPKVYRGIKPKNQFQIILPWNVGANGFYGHRVYASISHLIQTDCVMFLDEDNWYEPNHVETCLDKLNEKPELDFTFSYRNIMNKEGQFVCQDLFESRGTSPHNLVDTSSYCFKTEFLVKTGHAWHHGWGADRRYFNAVKPFAKFESTEKFTLNYRLDGNPNSPTEQFFIQGNNNATR